MIAPLVAASSLAHAQPLPQANAVFPKGGQRGTSVEVTVFGERLAEATGLVFSGDAGLKAELPPRAEPPVELLFSRGGAARVAADPNSLRVKIAIDADAPLGSRELRVVSPRGISNTVQFIVGSLPEAFDAEPNNTAAQAQAVALPITINGAIHAAAEVDSFKFPAKKGERFILDVNAYRNGSPLDGTLALLAPSGKALAQDEDTNGLDPLIDFTAPEDGDYVVQLRDLRYQGSAGHTYRLSVGQLPYLDAMFPAGARRGQELDLELYGRNLEGADKIKLKIANDAPLGRQDIYATAPKGISNPRPFEIGDAPETMEAEPNEAADKANEAALPGSINGRIGAEGDVDTFKFKLASARRLQFDLLASRFGSPLDAVLTLANDKGEVVAQSDDGAQADPVFAQRIEPGDYTLSIRDLLGRGGDRYIYRLTVRAPQPAFNIKWSPDAIRVWRGGSAAARVEVARDAGFSSAIRLSFQSLPPGVSSESVLLDPGEAAATLVGLTASADAPVGVYPIRLVGSGSARGERVERFGQPVRVIPAPPQEPQRDEAAREGFLVVMDGAPFTIEPVTLAADVTQDQATQVEAIIHRRPGFEGEVQVAVDGYSERRESIARSVGVAPAAVKPGETRATIGLTARVDSEVGSRRIVINGTAVVDGQSLTVQSPTLPLTIREIPFELANTLTRLSLTALPPETKSAAGEAEFTVKAERRGWFTDEIPLTLDGLPEGINVSVAPIPKGVSEATIKLTATDKAPIDKPITFRVAGAVTINGREYRQVAPPITLTISKPEGETETPSTK